MACSIEIIQLIKMIGHCQKTLGEGAFQQQYFLYNTYMNCTPLKNVYGQLQILTLICVDIQAADLHFLDIHGGTLL